MKSREIRASHRVRLALVIPAFLLACASPHAWCDDHGERPDISMVQAISNIESASGARVLDVEFDPRIKPISLVKGPPVYGLLTVKEQSFKVYFVDIATGKVLRQSPDWLQHRRKKALVKPGRLTQARISMVQAITLAESRTGGRAVQVRTKADGENLVYQVSTVADSKLRRMNIDAVTARLTEIPAD